MCSLLSSLYDTFISFKPSFNWEIHPIVHFLSKKCIFLHIGILNAFFGILAFSPFSVKNIGTVLLNYGPNKAKICIFECSETKNIFKKFFFRIFSYFILKYFGTLQLWHCNFGTLQLKQLWHYATLTLRQLTALALCNLSNFGTTQLWHFDNFGTLQIWHFITLALCKFGNFGT